MRTGCAFGVPFWRDAMPITRRLTTALAMIALMGGVSAVASCKPNSGVAGGGGSALSKYEAATDIPMGSKDAKVVMVEYASVTCGHCANLNNKVLPEIKEKYVKTGKVRYVYREFPTAPVELAMAGHLVARCAGGEKRDLVIDTIMRQQQELFTQAQGPTGAEQFFKTLAASVGMSDGQLDACLKNEALLKTLADVREAGLAAGVGGTPSIFINGEKFEGPAGREMETPDLAKALDAAIAKAVWVEHFISLKAQCLQLRHRDSMCLCGRMAGTSSFAKCTGRGFSKLGARAR
jgi:protein-disulfide isomerase